MSKRMIVRTRAKKDPEKRAARTQVKTPVQDPDATEWQQMHVVSERWRSDLVFFYDELSFFRKLIDRYFMWLIDEENIGATRKVASEVSTLEKKRFSILQKLDHHRKCIVNLTENPFSHNAAECRDEHSELEGLMAGFVKEAREVKKNVFYLTETVIDSEKAKHFLNI